MIDQLATFAGNRLVLLLSAGFIIAAIALAPGQFGSAHAELERSEPEAGSTVTSVPTQVVSYYSQELDYSGTTMTVLGPSGERVDRGDAAVDLCDPNRKRLTVSLLPDLPNGEYTVQWTTLSLEDAEVHEGSFTFTVAVPSGTPGATPSATPAASPEASPAASPAASATAC